MASKLNFFEKIDQKFVYLINNLAQDKLNKIDDKLDNSLPSETKQVLYQILSVFLVIAPLLVVVIFFVSNNNLRKEIENTRDIVSEIKSIENNEENLNTAVKSLISVSSIFPDNNLAKYLYSKLKAYDINLNNIIINSSEKIETIGDVEIIRLEGEVRGLGNKEISIVLDIIDDMSPSSINEIEIFKINDFSNLKFNLEARAKN